MSKDTIFENVMLTSENDIVYCLTKAHPHINFNVPHHIDTRLRKHQNNSLQDEAIHNDRHYQSGGYRNGPYQFNLYK